MQTLFASVIQGSFTLTGYALCMLCAFACGLIIRAASEKGGFQSKGMGVTLLILPAIVCTVVLMVNGSIGTGLAVAGTFALVRFRSIPGSAKEIVSVFLAVAAGLACSTGYLAIALIFTACVCLVMAVAGGLPAKADRQQRLVVSIPESLEFTGAFSDIFTEYLNDWQLERAKTASMGSLYKLYYRIEMKDMARLRDFIDAMRERNGNLEVSVGTYAEGGEIL